MQCHPSSPVPIVTCISSRCPLPAPAPIIPRTTLPQPTPEKISRQAGPRQLISHLDDMVLACTDATAIFLSQAPATSIEMVATDTSESVAHHTADSQTKRRKIAIACEKCREKKRRCDGARPQCGSCAKSVSGQHCVYYHSSWRIEGLEGPGR